MSAGNNILGSTQKSDMKKTEKRFVDVRERNAWLRKPLESKIVHLPPPHSEEETRQILCWRKDHKAEQARTHCMKRAWLRELEKPEPSKEEIFQQLEKKYLRKNELARKRAQEQQQQQEVEPMVSTQENENENSASVSGMTFSNGSLSWDTEDSSVQW